MATEISWKMSICLQDFGSEEVPGTSQHQSPEEIGRSFAISVSRQMERLRKFNNEKDKEAN